MASRLSTRSVKHVKSLIEAAEQIANSETNTYVQSGFISLLLFATGTLLPFHRWSSLCSVCDPGEQGFITSYETGGKTI